MTRGLALLLCLATAAPAAVWEGFELGGTRWSSAEEGGLIQAAISRDVASEGRHAFGGRVEVPSLDGAPKAGFWLTPDADFTGIDRFSFDLFNGTRAEWGVQLIIQTGNDWGWNAVDLGTLKPGWNRGLGVDLANGFGGKALMDFKAIPKISIVLTPKAPTQGALYLDHVRLDGPGAAALAPTVLAGAREQLLDSFEGGATRFKPLSGIGVRTEPDAEHASHGRLGLKLVAVSKDPEADGLFGYDAELDLAQVQGAVIDVYNPGPPAMFSFATAIGEGWDFAASAAKPLKTGWNRDLAFNFHARDFKSAASGWKNNGPLPSLKVRRFAFVWAPGDTGSLSLTLDNLRLRAVDGAVLKALAPAPALKGWETPLWAAGSGVPAKAGAEHPRARAASLSPAYSLPGAGPALRLDWAATERGQSADFEWAQAPDLRGARALRLDVYNPGADAVDFALALQVGAGQDWMESQVLRLAPGWNHGLELPLEGPVFKHAATQWAYGASLPGRGPEQLRRAYWHVLSPAAGPGSVYIGRAMVLRRSLLPGSAAPLALEGGTRLQAAFEPFGWELWQGFESGLAGWGGVLGDSVNGNSVLGLGREGASQGSQALRAELRGNGQDKARITYDPGLHGGAAIPDLSQVRRLRLDLYNPGPPLSVALVFTVGPGNTWVESPGQPLRSGWNHDVTFDLEAPVWKLAGSTAGGVATQTFGALPPALRAAGQVHNLNLLFNKARHGTVWVDNIRLGRDGGGSTSLIEYELGLRGRLGPLSIKIAGRAGNPAGSNAYVLPAGSHLKLAGLGQELALSFGEALPGFDDQLGVFTGRRQFDNGLSGYSAVGHDQLSALRWQGALGGLQGAAFGALPWGPAPFSEGGSALAGLRVKAAGPGGSWLGGVVLHQRLGLDPGAGPLDGAVEQSSQVLEADAHLPLPWGLSLGGGLARTQWGADPERRLLRDAQGLPLLWAWRQDARRDAVKAVAAWNLGFAELSGSYSDVGGGFDGSLSDTIFNAVRDEAKLLLRPGAWGWRPADDKQGALAGLGRGVSLSLATYAHASADKTYAGRTYELRLENDRNQPLGYVLASSAKTEDKAASAAQPLARDSSQAWHKGILRGQPWSGAGWQLGGLVRSIDYAVGGQASDWRAGLELTQRLWRVHVLSASVGSIAPLRFAAAAGPAEGNFNAWHAAWRAHWTEGLFSELSYGRPPFGEELADAWPVTDPVARLRLEASF